MTKMLSWTSSHFSTQPSCCPLGVMVGHKRTLSGAPEHLQAHKVIKCCINSHKSVQPVRAEEYWAGENSSLICEGGKCWGHYQGSKRLCFNCEEFCAAKSRNKDLRTSGRWTKLPLLSCFVMVLNRTCAQPVVWFLDLPQHLGPAQSKSLLLLLPQPAFKWCRKIFT